jgi:L-aspartate oxidase
MKPAGRRKPLLRHKQLPSRQHVPALVIGTGIAGLSAAWVLAEAGIDVLLVTKATDPSDTNTYWAQGGIIYRGKHDSVGRLEADVLAAGAGICNEPAVRFLASEGPKTVRRILIDAIRVPFSKAEDGELDLTREGAHSVARIVHASDATGRAIELALIARLLRHPGVRVVTESVAIDLLTTHHHSRKVDYQYQIPNECLGAYLLGPGGEVSTVLADFTVLATGGVGSLYLHTSNTNGAIGDGLVMAARAGATVKNVEYVQFHPTTLFIPGERRFLISEALRGEGARLVNLRGEQFMKRYAPKQRDLAPRDVVARAIVEEMTRHKEEHVYLDIAHNFRPHGSESILDRFPTIAAECAKHGVDISRDPIPVVPAAHYHCGGVLVDTSGRTTLERLYAVGECACSGVHGANRLASTSLLEGVTWGSSAARSILARMKRRDRIARPLFASIPDWQPRGTVENEDPALILQDWNTIRNTMWNYVGIVRTTARLERAAADFRDLQARLEAFYHRTRISQEIVELFHGVHAAQLITEAALRNTESRGCHYRQG